MNKRVRVLELKLLEYFASFIRLKRKSRSYYITFIFSMKKNTFIHEIILNINKIYPIVKIKIKNLILLL